MKETASLTLNVVGISADYLKAGTREKSLSFPEAHFASYILNSLRATKYLLSFTPSYPGKDRLSNVDEVRKKINRMDMESDL